MTNRTFCYTKAEEEALRDLIELEALVSEIPGHICDTEFQTQIYETVEQLQDLSLLIPQAGMIRKIVACFGDAYFFFNKTGDVCFLTDFISEFKQSESALVDTRSTSMAP